MLDVLVVYVWILDTTPIHSERTVVLRTQWKKKMNRPWRLTQTTNTAYSSRYRHYTRVLSVPNTHSFKLYFTYRRIFHWLTFDNAIAFFNSNDITLVTPEFTPDELHAGLCHAFRNLLTLRQSIRIATSASASPQFTELYKLDRPQAIALTRGPFLPSHTVFALDTYIRWTGAT